MDNILQYLKPELHCWGTGVIQLICGSRYLGISKTRPPMTASIERFQQLKGLPGAHLQSVSRPSNPAPPCLANTDLLSGAVILPLLGFHINGICFKSFVSGFSI